MGAQTEQTDSVRGFVYPYQQEVIFNVTLHTSLVKAVQFVRFMNRRDFLTLL